MLIAIWLIALLALGAWSLGAWGLSTLLASVPNDWSGLVAWIEKLPPNPWLESFFPGWQGMLAGLVNMTETVLSWAGGAADVMRWAVWILWGLGTLFLMVCAVLGSLLVTWIRKNKPSEHQLRAIDG